MKSFVFACITALTLALEVESEVEKKVSSLLSQDLTSVDSTLGGSVQKSRTIRKELYSDVNVVVDVAMMTVHLILFFWFSTTLSFFSSFPIFRPGTTQYLHPYYNGT